MQPRPWHRHYDAGVPIDLAPDAATVVDLLEQSAGRWPERDALSFFGKGTSYRALWESVGRVSEGFARLGVGRDARVAIQLPNLPQAVIAYFAALRLGAQVVLTNPLYTPAEIEHQWRDAGCTLAVVADFLWVHKVRGIRGALPVKSFVVARVAEALPWPLSWIAPWKLARTSPPTHASFAPEPGLTRFRDLARGPAPSAARPSLAPGDVAVLQYTGGTTGVSKAAMLTHANLAANARQIQAWFTACEPGREVVLTCLPLFHVFGMTVGMNWPLSTGATIVLEPNPRDCGRLVRAIERRRVTVFPGVPALYNSITSFPGIERRDLGSVKACVSGSAPLPEDVLHRFEELTGAVIVEGYGLSETSPVTHCNPLRGRRKIGSIGVPLSGTDARVVDAEDPDKEMPVGEPGELALAGPQVMRGYWNQPAETAHALRDGWFLTGDLAQVDADGYFRIVGRKKEMVNVGGFKVFPDEIDRCLSAHPAVLDAATIGVPRPGKGELVKSFVVLRPGASAAADELRAWLGERLAPYKVPRELEFLDALPRSTVLKVLRRELLRLELAKRGDGA